MKYVEFDETESMEVGSSAPDFELMTNSGEPWKLSNQRGEVIALLFYPGNETLVCTKQLCSVRDNWKEYQETKAQIIGVSPGDSKGNFEFADKHRLPFPILADEGRRVTRRFGFHWLFPISLVRAIVIVDAKGVIRARTSMFRGFRPSDGDVIRSIYSARSDALDDRYESMRKNK